MLCSYTCYRDVLTNCRPTFRIFPRAYYFNTRVTRDYSNVSSIILPRKEPPDPSWTRNQNKYTCRESHRSSVCSWFTSERERRPRLFVTHACTLMVSADIARAEIEIEIKMDPSVNRFPFRAKFTAARTHRRCYLPFCAFERAYHAEVRYTARYLALPVSRLPILCISISGFTAREYLRFSN